VVREHVSTPVPRVAVAVAPVIVQLGAARLEIPTGIDRSTLATIFEVLLSSGRGAVR
jgi:hypothetical protein